jgi:hypothetical protein
MHGGFVVGVLIALIIAMALFLQKKFFRGLLLSFITGLTLLATPYGLTFLGFIKDALLNPPSNIPTNPPCVIPEWNSILHSPQVAIVPAIFLLIMLLGRPGFVGPGGIVAQIPRFCIFVLTMYMGISHERFLPFFLFYALMLELGALERGAKVIATFLGERAVTIQMAFCTVIIAIVSSLPLGLVLTVKQGPLLLNTYPVAALDWLLKNNKGGKVLTHYNDGSYALWRLYPSFKIALDGRFDGVFPVETMEKVFTALDPRYPRHLEELAAYSPDFVLLDFTRERRSDVVSGFPGYSIKYEDQRFGILVRDAKAS